MIKALIFDFDGTLIHLPQSYLLNVVNKSLESLNAEKPSVKDFKRFWYEHERDNFIQEKFRVEAQEFWKAFNIFDKERSKASILYPDTLEIKALKSKGYKIGFFTGTNPATTEHYLEILGFKQGEETTVNNWKECLPPKPHPAGLELCMSRIKTKPEETAYIGNGDEDILTARNAKVLDIIVDRKEYRLKEKPSLKIESLQELEKAIRK